jgi:hypothetical protein
MSVTILSHSNFAPKNTHADALAIAPLAAQTYTVYQIKART